MSAEQRKDAMRDDTLRQLSTAMLAPTHTQTFHNAVREFDARLRTLGYK